MKARNIRTGQTIIETMRRSSGIFSKLIGLLFTKELPEGHGMWLVPCSSIHTFGMRYAIDVIYLNKKQKVIKLVKQLEPNRFAPFSFQTRSIVEIPAGALDRLDIAVHDDLEMIE